jgi:hypothetical protein
LLSKNDCLILKSLAENQVAIWSKESEPWPINSSSHWAEVITKIANGEIEIESTHQDCGCSTYNKSCEKHCDHAHTTTHNGTSVYCSDCRTQL